MISKEKAYGGSRPDVLSLISSPTRVLDVGCNTGNLGASIKARFPKSWVCGIELDESAASRARTKLDHVIVGDLESIDQEALPLDIDTIVLADVIEHMKDPDQVLKKLLKNRSKLSVIVSVPNVQHITVLMSLLRGRWDYRDRGIFDTTHLRFFTKSTAIELFEKNGCRLVRFKRKYRIIDRPGGAVNKFSRLFSIPLVRNFFSYQYLFEFNYER